MKKSRIIIPALAVMALSMGAAVTSTVAWFTANRNASATSSAITVINPEGNLYVKAKPGSGTKPTVDYGLQDSNLDSVTITHNGKLRDGSVDLTSPSSPVVYTSKLNDSGSMNDESPSASSEGRNVLFRTVSSTGTDTNGYLDKGSFVAYSYELEFTFGDASTPNGTYGLFIDGLNSTLTAGQSNPLAPALRVAVVNEGNGVNTGDTAKYLALAPADQLTVSDKYCVSTDRTKNYVVKNIAKKERTATYETMVNAEQATNNIGDFKFASGEGNSAMKKTIKVYTWLDGNDVLVGTTDNILSGFVVDLHFHIIAQ